MKRGIIFALIFLVVLSACTVNYRQEDPLANLEESADTSLEEEELINDEESDETELEDDMSPQPNMQEDEMPAVENPTLYITIAHTSYSPDSFTVKKGEPVSFLATAASGTGSHNHGITIDEFGVNEAVTTTDAANPKLIRFVPNQSGTFIIYCKTCWDGPFGMGHPNIRATLIVEE